MADEETTEEAKQLLQEMRKYGEEFATLRQRRHEAGAAEYGRFTFLQNDVIRMMCEELADTANYCEMQFIKLRLLQDLIQLPQSEQIGAQSFRGTKEGWDGR